MYALLEKDEEVDTSIYAAYLRAQSNADLLDIVLHLDPERYPARVDAARRETLRRHVLPVTVHTTEERFIRGLAVVAMVFSFALVLLAVLLVTDDIVEPRWQDLSQIPDGTPVSTIMRLGLLGVLRAVVVSSVHAALVALTLLTLAGWLLAHVRRHTIRADVKRLALIACLVLCAAFALAAAPFSSVPALLDPSSADSGFATRLLTLLKP